MNKKNLLITLLIIHLFVILSGCWSRKELTELAIAVALSIDKDGDGNYIVAAQIVDPSEVASKQGVSSGKTAVTIFQSTRPTVIEALREMTTSSPRKIYLSHLRIVVIGEKLAKEGIGEALEFFLRDHEVRPDFYIVLGKGNEAQKFLEVLTPLEKIPAQRLHSSLETSERFWAPTQGVTIDTLISDIISDGKEPVLTVLEIIGDPNEGSQTKNIEKVNPKTQLKYNDLAMLKQDKLVGFMNETESKGYNYLINKVNNTVGHISCGKDEKNSFVIEIFRTQTQIKTSVKNGKPSFHVNLKGEGNITEFHCLKKNISIQEDIKALEKEIEKQKTTIVQTALKKAQEEKSDIFGFGETLHQQNPDVWEKVKKDWSNEVFPTIDMKVTSEFKIRRSGTTDGSFLLKYKKTEKE